MRVVEVTDFGGPEVLVPSEAEDPVAKEASSSWTSRSLR